MNSQRSRITNVVLIVGLIGSLADEWPKAQASGKPYDMHQLEGVFRNANASENIKGLERLVYWNKASSQAKRDLRQKLRAGLGKKIDKIEVLSFANEKKLFGESLTNATLPPSRVFVVWYIFPPDKAGTPIVGVRYPIGIKGDAWYIIPADGSPISSIHY